MYSALFNDIQNIKEGAGLNPHQPGYRYGVRKRGVFKQYINLLSLRIFDVGKDLKDVKS